MRLCILSAGFVVLATLTGCASEVQVRHRSPQNAFRQDLQSRLGSESLSGFTKDALYVLSLEDVARRDPISAIQQLRDHAAAEPGTPWRLAASELLLDLALESSPQDLSLYLACAYEADLYLRQSIERQQGLLDSKSALAAGLYRRAIARFLTGGTQSWLQDGVASEAVDGAGGSFKLSMAPGEPRRLYGPGEYDTLIPTDTVRVTGMSQHHRLRAFGAPVNCIREQERADPPRAEPLIPPEGMMMPGTVTLDFGEMQDCVMQVEVELWNTDFVTSIGRHGERVRLSVDTTVPIATLFARAELVGRGHRGLTDVQGYESRIGLYLHEPYDSKKIPVVLVHGLRSSPATWREMLNSFRADPVLRERYQFWMFLYPSGLPVPRSAYYLRTALSEARSLLAPDGPTDSMNQMVLVGHSMGGLISKAVLQDSGDELWDSLHPDRFEDVEMPPVVREHLHEVFFYEADQCVSRVVFIATPHKGSSIASSLVGRIGDSMVSLTDELNEVDRWFRAEQLNVEQDPTRQLHQGVPTSIDDLRPDSPHLVAYTKLPIRSGVQYHSIAGNASGDSDGVVSVESALLEGAESELVVDAGHNVHEHPMTIREVRRILLLHAESLD